MKDAPELRIHLDRFNRGIAEIYNEASKKVVGRRVRVTSNFNGQPHGGRSRKPLTGKILIIDSVHFNEGSEISFCGHHEDGSWLGAGFWLSDIEFLEE